MKKTNNKEKNRNTRKETNNIREKRKKHTMQIMTVGRKPIACKPKTDAKGGVGSLLQWRRKKRHSSGRWQSERGGD
jgi:hypothetical protein